MNPTHLKLLKKAQALDVSRKPLEAAVTYRMFLDCEPNHVDSWVGYSSQLLKLGDPEKAQEACERAIEINPSGLAARIQLAVILIRRDQFVFAEDQLRLVLRVDPVRMDALLILVQCLLDRRNLVGAREALKGASHPWAMTGKNTVLRPQFAEHWALLGLALMEDMNFEEAERACTMALQVDPRNLRATANLGSIRMAQGRLEEAESLFEGLVAEHPGNEKVRLLLITYLARAGKRDSTIQEAANVVRLAPTSFEVHKSLMGPYYSLGCWAEYAAELERFRGVAPGLAYLDFEQSFVDLLFGDFLQGWEHFEARLAVPDTVRPRRAFNEPAWGGEAFAGKTLLLWAEQGLGDTLMCLRYLPMVKALGGRVLLEAQAAVLNVAGTCRGLDGLVPGGELLPHFDLQASIMSLPRVFRTELATIPDTVPYVRVPVDVPHRQGLQERLSTARDCTRIGLVWAGNPTHARDSERSVPASALAPLAVLPGVAWFSLQLGDQSLPPLPDLVSLAPFLGDFSDTAYALSEMDLLITVDTSVAHLAGALGVPTLLLLAHQPDYRWMLERHDSPWYPTLRLYRQPAYGDWASVIAQVISDLSQ